MVLVLQVRPGIAAAPVTTIPLRTLLAAAGHRPGGGSPSPVLAEVLRLWDAGRNTTEIAAAVGIGRATVTGYVRTRRERGAPRRPAHNGHAREVLEERGPELRAAYEAGRSIVDLAGVAGIAMATLRGYLVAEGVAIRTRPGRPRSAGGRAA